MLRVPVELQPARGPAARSVELTHLPEERVMGESEYVVLVNERNRRIGVAEKLHAHREGLLHRAFSVFLVDADRRLLLHRRASQKYHSGGLWANSCCGHPRPFEPARKAASRRLYEELRTGTSLRKGFDARYRVRFGNGLFEDEIVHVFFGRYAGDCDPDPAEVSDVELCRLEGLSARKDLAYWLQHYLREHSRDIERCIEEVVRSC
jgi:isopentenyl-diphosphate delta-isomerase